MTSRWLPMPDGARIAIDVILPGALTASGPTRSTLGTALIVTRYWRSFRLRTPGTRPGVPIGPDTRLIEALVSQGRAVVVADARGTGASDGTWTLPWSDQEIADAGEIADWIAVQPWSNGCVAAVGVSYAGTAAILLGGLGRPSVRAVVASNIEFDIFTDAVAPGGVRNRAFVGAWSDAVGQLDRDRAPAIFGRIGRLLVAGVRPVDEDRGRANLRRIVHGRQVHDVASALGGVEARDDPYGDSGVAVGAIGIPGHLDALRARMPPTQLWASWLDGATAGAALRMWQELPAIREVRITATSHTGEHGAGPFAEGEPPEPSVADRLAEIDRFLTGPLERPDRRAVLAAAGDPPSEDGPRVIRYVTMGETPVWRTTSVWPPADTVMAELFLARDGRLQWEQGHDMGSAIVPLERNASTGRFNRWLSGLARPVRYGNRRRPDALLATWTGEPLPAPLTITGQPVAVLGVRVRSRDVALIVYLELVTLRGEVRYLTEGLLRAQHRGRGPESEPTYLRRDLHPLEPDMRTELRIPLQPTSVQVPAGWRLRVAVAGADRHTFAALANQPPEITVELGGPASSRLLLPIVD